MNHGAPEGAETGMLLGCIADDFTGATDLANTLTRRGLPCVQYNGLPDPDLPAGAEPAAVVALKTRSIAAADAVEQSLAALAWLRANDCGKVFFKICSTFDSTDEGNIGPVAEVLLDALGGDLAIVCPAAPENGRTVYLGHLFVGEALLSESGMRNHPLNPMTDSNLVAVLGRQSAGAVGLVPYRAVDRGASAMAEVLERLRGDGVRLAIVDALSEAHLEAMAEAGETLPLLVGGSGLGLGLPGLFRRRGRLAEDPPQPAPPEPGLPAVLSGSCSDATNRQVAVMRERCPSYLIDPYALAEGEGAIAEALAWAEANLGEMPILFYATAPAGQVAEVQRTLGLERSSQLVEQAMAAIAEGLRARGVRRLVVAGGETSGAVVSALGARRLAIGPEIDPGVPWTFGLDAPRMALALKSGNFGAPDFFTKAFEVLQ